MNSTFICLPKEGFKRRIKIIQNKSESSFVVPVNFFTRSLSTEQDIVCGVPQGSVLGPLLFNFFLNDFLLFIQDCDVCNFADDNTLFKYDRNIEKVALSLENDISNAIYWFKWNQMVANPCKFQVMFLGLNKEIEMQLNINNKQIKVVNTVKLLGITVDSKLKFDQHANAISKKANSKIRAFSRVSHYLEQPKAKTLYNTFIMSCFNYSPLINRVACLKASASLHFAK